MFSSLQVRNVQEAYVRGLQLIRSEGVLEETRNGGALVIPWPVVTIYERPHERVLLDPVRDCNPFFHLMEAMWILAGRNDVRSLDPFNSSFKQFSDNGATYHGAYGHRWRHHFDEGDHSCQDQDSDTPIDQLARVIELLRTNPGDRRIVLQMWDPQTDLGRDGRDFPCNTQCLFRVRRRPGGGWNTGVNDLDMTVFNRSNDAIWGAYGSNAVHFSILQEFVAAAIGCSVGHMYQWSNNLHAYTATLEKAGEPRLYTRRDLGDERVGPLDSKMVGLTMYEDSSFRADPLFRPRCDMSVESILAEIEEFWDDTPRTTGLGTGFITPRGARTLELVRASYLAHKQKDYSNALSCARDIPLLDWRRACVEYLERRAAARDAKSVAGPGPQ